MLIPSSHFGREVSNNAVRRLHSTGEYCESDLVANKVANPLARCWAHDAPMRSGYGGRPASPQLAMTDLANKIEFEEGSMLHAHSHSHSALLNYHPNLLDDPALWIAGKHSTLLTFPSYMVIFKYNSVSSVSYCCKYKSFYFVWFFGFVLSIPLDLSD